jgi:hypothetical protein
MEVESSVFRSGPYYSIGRNKKEIIQRNGKAYITEMEEMEGRMRDRIIERKRRNK